MSESQHTPTPWEAVTRDHSAIVRTVAGARKVAEARSREPLQIDEINATFIVKAVNSHEKLIDAHDDLVGVLRDIARQAEDETLGIQADRLMAIANQAHAAIRDSEATQ